MVFTFAGLQVFLSESGFEDLQTWVVGCCGFIVILGLLERGRERVRRDSRRCCVPAILPVFSWVLIDNSLIINTIHFSGRWFLLSVILTVCCVLFFFVSKRKEPKEKEIFCQSLRWQKSSSTLLSFGYWRVRGAGFLPVHYYNGAFCHGLGF